MHLEPPGFPSVWQDLQGAFSMRVISGAAIIYTGDVYSYIPTDATHANEYALRVIPVPEPHLGAFFVIITIVSLIRGLGVHRRGGVQQAGCTESRDRVAVPIGASLARGR